MPPKKGKHQIPEQYLEDNPQLPDGFQEAYDHAIDYGNNEKASLIYAEHKHAFHDPNAPKEKE